MLGGLTIVIVVALVLWIRHCDLKRRVEALEARLASLERGADSASATDTASPPPVPAARRPEPAAETPPPAAATPPRTDPPDVAPTPGPEPEPGPGLATRLHSGARRWFTEGNVPVKVGMLVLFAGVAALLKYAADQGWMQLSIEARLVGVSIVAAAGLAFGWRQRRPRRTFALSLQGGAIGVLLLAVFAAFRQYALLPSGVAFGLSVLLVMLCGTLAVAQNALALAVLGILAGFLAPILLSDGGGSHVVLFSYYAVLNAAVFGIAWWRAWRGLNLLGFVFTFGIATAWGALEYRAADFASTEPFLLLFFAFYLVIPILYARRQRPNWRDLVDGSLVFGTPLLAFALQARLLDGQRLPLAGGALGLAALYAALAWVLRRRAHFAPLAQCHGVLAATFATLAVPLSLSARATAAVFAIEGAALVWLGLQQNLRATRLVGLGLQGLAALSFVGGRLFALHDETAIANPTFMGALLVAVGGFASAWAYRNADRSKAALACYGWGLAWWLGNGLHEIGRFLRPDNEQAGAALALVALTGWLAAEFQRRRPDRVLRLTLAAMLALAMPLALLQWQGLRSPFAGSSGLAWLAHAAFGIRALLCLRSGQGRMAGIAHAAWLWSWLVALALGLESAVPHQTAWTGGTRSALIMLPWLLATAGSIWRPAWVAWPLQNRFAAWRAPLQTSWFALLAALWVTGLLLPARSPLLWLPVLNPLELAQLASLGLAVAWLYGTPSPACLRERRSPLATGAGFLLLTAMLLRVLHHWGDVPWSERMFSTGLVQTGLTILWSLIGMGAWIVGSRRGQRTVWLAGAALMAVVLAKLVLVDRQHLGNLLGIVSFIAYGLLCTAVGYFAPAPPRAKAR